MRNTEEAIEDGKKARALADHLGVEFDDVTEDRWGTFSADGGEYRVLTDDEADAEVKDYIRESVWAFNARFLAYHIKVLDAEDIDRLRGDRCEDANEVLVKLIDDFDHFVNDAILADGRGHFLSHYDGEEVELSGDFFAYRTN